MKQTLYVKNPEEDKVIRDCLRTEFIGNLFILIVIGIIITITIINTL